MNVPFDFQLCRDGACLVRFADVIVEDVVRVLQDEDARVVVLAQTRDELEGITHRRVSRRQGCTEGNPLRGGYVSHPIFVSLCADIDMQGLAIGQPYLAPGDGAVTLAEAS